MKINKVTMTIVVEVAHIDSIHGLVTDFLKDLDNEVVCGMKRMEDGDEIRWNVKNLEIEI